MDDANGSLKGPKANGMNGAIKTSPNGHVVSSKHRIASAGPGFLAWTFSITARLLTWYSIITILLRCPATLDACDETSPRLCKPYFQLKQSVTPHLEPYYDAYAAPYVDLARPYYNTVDEVVIAPSWRFAKKHGAPRVQQVQAFSQTQWERTVQPQIAKIQGVAQSQYDQTLATHVNRVSTAVGPYYDIARTNALQTYHDLLLPSYKFVHPYAHRGYLAASAFTAKTAVPSAVWAWNKTYVFLDGTVWPQLRVVYVENVEPQLLKIGKRLGRYNGKKTVQKSVVESSSSSPTKLASASSFAKPLPSVSSTTSSTWSASASVDTSTSSAATPVSSTSVDSGRSVTESLKIRSSVEPVPPPEGQGAAEKESPARRAAREIVAADLKDWQERYSKAADEGAAEIDERVQEIAKRMIRRNAKIMGKSLVEQLEAGIVNEMVELRRQILHIVGSAKKGSQENAQERIVAAVRQAGMAIKNKAVDVRTWRENYEAEMRAAITKAAETHFSILENIRDLALQKIGMKWAWTDGITYKDWAKYHLLKTRFEEWKGDLENLIVNHPSLEAAQLEGANLEDEAMKLAGSAARELARLKQVAAWKLAALDDTPEFDSTLMQQAAEAVEAAKVAAANLVNSATDSAGAAKDAVVDKAEEGINAAAEALGEAGDAISSSQQVVVDKVAEAAESVQSAAAPSLEDATSEAAEPTAATSSADSEPAIIASEELSTVVEPITEATPIQEVPDVASVRILEETPIILGNTTELKEDGPGPVELPQDEESDLETVEEAPVPSTTSIKPVFLGAAAHSAPSRKPVMDDTLDDAAGALESMRQEVQSAYSFAVSRANQQYSQALSIMSARISGTPEPAHEKLLASVTSAYSDAMASASSHLDNALKVASDKVYGTPTAQNKILPTSLALPTVPAVDWAHVESIAAERLRQGRAWAEEQYESAKIAAGLATPTPSTPSEHVSKMLENARHNYYAGIGVAHARYSDFMSAASAAVSSMTATPTPTDLAGTASSIASVASESAASAASAASSAASAAASAAGDNVAGAAAAASSIASVASESAASAASIASSAASAAASAASENVAGAASAASSGASSIVSVASENVAAAASAGYDNASAAADKVAESWDVVVNKISVQIYGAPTPTPWYASVYNVAGEYAASATEGAGSATQVAGAYAAAASDEAAKQYQAVSSILSELLLGKEPTFSESVLSRLNAAYSTGVASASSIASEVHATAVSAGSEAGEAAKSVGSKVSSAASQVTAAIKDEL